MRIFRLGVILLLFCGIAAAIKPVRQVKKHHARRPLYQRIRHPFWHPVFPPSHESLLRQNAEINRLALPRLYDDDDLSAAVERGDLVALPLSPALKVDPRLDPDRRYCRPWTAKFLTDISNEFYLRFGTSLQVNSAVRTVLVQKKLRRHNRNAAPFEGETASSHLAGLTVDLERKRLTKQQVRWVQLRLMYYYARGWVEVEEEYHQLCFHIMVSGRYADPIEPLPVRIQIDYLDEDDGDYAAPNAP